MSDSTQVREQANDLDAITKAAAARPITAARPSMPLAGLADVSDAPAMSPQEFGAFITKLINKHDLSREETSACFREILENRQSDMQQGAFLAALTAKGETAEEIAAAWQTIYELDTVKVNVDTDQPLVENCGTGMDAVKTFNISTAASIIAAADGVPMAKHGARAITSACGTVDIIEELGVNVECSPDVVKKSIETAGIGIFNGMSSLVHPTALGRILSQIAFGTVLNIAASLANPALPRYAIRGVYSRDLLAPTAEIMREIGYSQALVVYGEGEPGMTGGIDEASTMGCSYICELSADGHICEYQISPEEFGLKPARAADLCMGGDRMAEAKRMKELLGGRETSERTDIACLNAGLILYLAGRQPSIQAGYERARNLLETDQPLDKLRDWVRAQQ
ncbi:MAG: anthranilate phosphoribosyltransferase [Actinomycetia bacterium]|nr:anthranilate phosphoribosyltransferase [Actinomycetes bacterium]